MNQILSPFLLCGFSTKHGRPQKRVPTLFLPVSLGRSRFSDFCLARWIVTPARLPSPRPFPLIPRVLGEKDNCKIESAGFSRGTLREKISNPRLKRRAFQKNANSSPGCLANELDLDRALPSQNFYGHGASSPCAGPSFSLGNHRTQWVFVFVEGT